MRNPLVGSKQAACSTRIRSCLNISYQVSPVPLLQSDGRHPSKGWKYHADVAYEMSVKSATIPAESQYGPVDSHKILVCLFKPLYKHDTVSYKRITIMLVRLSSGGRGFHALSPPSISLIQSIEKPSKLACLWIMRLTVRSGRSRNEMNENPVKVGE